MGDAWWCLITAKDLITLMGKIKYDFFVNVSKCYNRDSSDSVN
jgi:hypothetical protein